MRICFFLGVLCILTSCSSEVPSSVPDISLDTGIHVFEASRGFDIFFDSGASRSIQEYYSSGNIILNGSYFGKTLSGSYFPAGIWKIGKDKTYPLDLTDPNLSHVVIMKNNSTSVQILSNKEFINHPNTSDDRVFQAGPLVLSGNILQDLGSSWHARGPHERILLGVTKGGKVYFFVFTYPISLTDVADKIVQDDRFTLDPLTLLNLDGGPSTAYFDGKIGFREDTKLPIVIRIR